jgi:hypothetical protein
MLRDIGNFAIQISFTKWPGRVGRVGHAVGERIKWQTGGKELVGAEKTFQEELRPQKFYPDPSTSLWSLHILAVPGRQHI